MSVVEAVFAFDGTHVEELRGAVAGYDASEASDLLALCSSETPRYRVAATWIVKAVLQSGVPHGLDLEAYFACLARETEWGAILHLLQSVEYAAAPAIRQRAAIGAFLSHGKTLVKVGALDAHVRVALASDSGLGEARRAVEAALTHDKASVRARARHLAPHVGVVT